MSLINGVDGRVTVARVDEHFALRRAVTVIGSALSRSEGRLELALAGGGSHKGRQKRRRDQSFGEELHGEVKEIDV